MLVGTEGPTNWSLHRGTVVTRPLPVIEASRAHVHIGRSRGVGSFRFSLSTEVALQPNRLERLGEHERVDVDAACALIIGLAPTNLGKSEFAIEGLRRCVVRRDL